MTEDIYQEAKIAHYENNYVAADLNLLWKHYAFSNLFYSYAYILPRFLLQS